MFDQAPNNLPTEPEDILAEGESTAPSASAADSLPPVDEQGSPTTALSAGRLRPAAPVSPSVGRASASAALPVASSNISSPAVSPSTAPESMQDNSDVEITPPILNKRNLFIIVVVALVILIAGGALLVWRSSAKRAASGATTATAPQTETSSAAPTAEENSPAAVLAPTEATSTTETAATQPPSPAVDADGDGLTDQQEIQYGTDPQKADTDGDNLTDYEEIFIWHTNPLNPDTDGDGYSDGQEVKNGFNPNGSGKLLNIPNTSAPTSAATTTAPVAPAIPKL